MLNVIFENPALTVEVARVAVVVMAVGIFAAIAVVIKKGV